MHSGPQGTDTMKFALTRAPTQAAARACPVDETMGVLTATAVFLLCECGMSLLSSMRYGCYTWVWIENSGDAAFIGAGVFDFGSNATEYYSCFTCNPAHV